MLRLMSMRELQGWITYYELEPSLDQRIDWLIASVVQMVHNSPREAKHQKPIKDFVLKFEQPTASSTKLPWERQKAMMMLYLTGQKGQKEE